MFAVVKMLCGVPVPGGVAAADMTTFHAQTQVNPGIARLNAILADVRLGAGDFGMEKMTATIRHWNNPLLLCGPCRWLCWTFERRAVPFAGVCAGFVSTLKELEQRAGW